jgi:hypothetical protein
MIAKYCIENDIGQRPTVHNCIFDELIPDDKIYYEKTGNSFRRFYINDKNEFNILLSRIEKMSNKINKVTDVVQSKKDLFKTISRPETFLNFAQSMYHSFITKIASDIDSKIKSTGDRELLYSALVGLLFASNRLNNAMMPQIMLADARASISTIETPKIRELLNSMSPLI